MHTPNLSMRLQLQRYLLSCKVRCRRAAHFLESRTCRRQSRVQAQSWTKPRRVVAKVEWHPGELYPRVGFIVTNLVRPAERVVAFYNQRGTAE